MMLNSELREKMAFSAAALAILLRLASDWLFASGGPLPYQMVQAALGVKMTINETARLSNRKKSNWLYYLLTLLVIEKTIQHIVVTLAFYFNWGDIASTVAISPNVLMILGAIAAILFAVSLWGMVTKQAWTIRLVIALALFDMVGEFAAQGRIDIVITVSFIVATLLLILAVSYRRQMNRLETE